MNEDYAFRNRWRITGTWTTSTPLHIGSGESEPRAKLLNEADGEPVEINAVAVDHNGAAYIPGSALKGNLRAWLERRLPGRSEIGQVFGAVDDDGESISGGRCTVRDARMADDRPSYTSAVVPHYCAKRGTGVVSQTAIHRDTRTVLDQRLFHTEYVPPGVSFRIVVDGQNLTDEDVSILLYSLNGFGAGASDLDPVRLGAGEGYGWGHGAWKLDDVRRVTRDELLTRRNAFRQREGRVPLAYESCEPISVAERTSLLAKADGWAHRAHSPQLVRLRVRLEFDGAFLVNESAWTNQDRANPEKSVAFTPRKTADGRIILPAQSLRGAFRSRAERIVRTFQPDQAPASDLRPRRLGTDPTWIDMIFGEAGRAAAVRFTDFVQESECQVTDQELIAIDRFTGGGAAGLKFRGRRAMTPTLIGEIRFHLDRLSVADAGLLALTFRDLVEGDITLGFGAGKGFGACRAAITHASVPARSPGGEWDTAWETLNSTGWLVDREFEIRGPLPAEAKEAVRTAVDQCRERLRQGATK